MKARILVRDWDLEDVHPGAAAKAKVIPFPYRTYSGKVDQILPAAAADRPVSETQDLQRLGQQLTNYFAVDMEFANPDGSLREGMTGTAKIAGKKVLDRPPGDSGHLALDPRTVLVRLHKPLVSGPEKGKGPPFLGRRPFGGAATSILGRLDLTGGTC